MIPKIVVIGSANTDMVIQVDHLPAALGDESTAIIRARLCTAQCHRILKLSRMIADLAGSDEIQSTHLAEALQYRPKIMVGQVR